VAFLNWDVRKLTKVKLELN